MKHKRKGSVRNKKGNEEKEEKNLKRKKSDQKKKKRIVHNECYLKSSCINISRFYPKRIYRIYPKAQFLGFKEKSFNIYKASSSS